MRYIPEDEGWRQRAVCHRRLGFVIVQSRVDFVRAKTFRMRSFCLPDPPHTTTFWGCLVQGSGGTWRLPIREVFLYFGVCRWLQRGDKTTKRSSIFWQPILLSETNACFLLYRKNNEDWLLASCYISLLYLDDAQSMFDSSTY